MKSGIKCGDTAISQSMCMIVAILDDVKASYTHVGGGGITEIKMIATNTYTVAISQEERVDLITYVLKIKNGMAQITSRTESTKTPGR
jgi:hypothetical protein